MNVSERISQMSDVSVVLFDYDSTIAKVPVDYLFGG
jgi:hypothetical protein